MLAPEEEALVIAVLNSEPFHKGRLGYLGVRKELLELKNENTVLFYALLHKLINRRNFFFYKPQNSQVVLNLILATGCQPCHFGQIPGVGLGREVVVRQFVDDLGGASFVRGSSDILANG